MKDLTQGSVLSHALTMAVPIFAGLVLVLLCGLIDLYFVAGLGEAAIAGVGAAGHAGFLVSALTQIVSVGTLAAVSQAVGRKDRRVGPIEQRLQEASSTNLTSHIHFS